jgi:hypothetical protein
MRLRWSGHIESMNNERMPKQVATARMEGTGKRGRPRKRLTNEAEGGMKTMEIRNWTTVARDQKEWSRKVLEGKVYNGL